MMTPGTYLKLRRQAAGLSVDDVAGLVHTAPHLGAFDRSAWIGRIESDVAAISPDVVRALASAFRFDRRVLLRLIDLRSYGADIGVTPAHLRDLRLQRRRPLPGRTDPPGLRLGQCRSLQRLRAHRERGDRPCGLKPSIPWAANAAVATRLAAIRSISNRSSTRVTSMPRARG